jgi:diguanylate cyclase (GGDEF)-like protein
MQSTSPAHLLSAAAHDADGLDPLFRLALDSAAVGLIVLDADGIIRLLSGAAARLFGLPAGLRGLGLPIHQMWAYSPLLAPDSSQRLVAALAHALAHSDGEARELLLFTLPTAGARRLWVEIRPAAELGWVISIEDVTAARETQDWLLDHVSSDPVTGLWNRQRFVLMLRDRLNLALTARPPALSAASASPRVRPPLSHGLVMIGLHRFKHVNDVFGVGAGDMVLRLVGERLLAKLTDGDMLACFAGEEFAMFISREGGRAALSAFAERIFADLAAPYTVDGQIVNLSARAGIACAPEHGCAPEMLIANAGVALQETTARGAPRLCFFDPQFTERAHLRLSLEADLRTALERREFELHYQPQVNLALDCVTGFEALIRWRHPQRGLVSPVEFIALAEQIGLITDIGEWVLCEACREAATWPEGITVAVNASPLQFETGSFARIVSEALTVTGLAARRLEIEITESLLLRDTGTVMGTLASLHQMGVRLVLDDFGTGYASLSQLSRFRFDKIKIDRSFVSPAVATVENGAIVRSIAALGHSLGIPTTAEGVETEGQLAQIRQDGCTSVQGYFYSRPVPAGDVAGVLDRLHQPRGG